MPDMIIHTSVDLDVPAAAAWKLFGEGFGDWADWAPGIDSSTLQGALAQGVVRVNETPSLGTVRQELARFDPDARALAYEMTDNLPPVFSRLRNDWVIEEVDAGTSRLRGEALFVLNEQAVPMQDKLRGKMGMTLQVFANAFRDQLS